MQREEMFKFLVKYLRETYKVRSGHAHELVSALLGYKSYAAFQALHKTYPIKYVEGLFESRRVQLKETTLPPDIESELVALMKSKFNEVVTRG